MKLNTLFKKSSLFLLTGLAVGSALALPQSSQAAVRINTLGLFEYAMPSTGGSFLSAGGGVSFDFGFGKSPVSLDIGGYYVHAGFDIGPGASVAHLPAFLRFSFARDIVSLGVGFFTDIYTSSGTLGWGPIGSLQFRIPMGKMVSFVLDGRYGMDMSDLSGTGTYLHKIDGLAGLSFKLGGGR